MSALEGYGVKYYLSVEVSLSHLLLAGMTLEFLFLPYYSVAVNSTAGRLKLCNAWVKVFRIIPEFGVLRP